MRQLLPVPLEEVDVIAAYGADLRPPLLDRPWVVVNMIASVDGATAVDSRSGALGGPPDKAVFRALREIPDVILVGAETIRAEGYGPVRLSEEAVQRRRALGHSDVPRLAIISGSLELDPTSSLFTESVAPPVVLTCATADPARRSALAEVAEVHTAGEQRVSMAAGLRVLHALGAACVLSEGGPTVNAQLLADDLVDEWCQTISPLLVAGDSSRSAVGPLALASTAEPGPASLRLDRLLEQDGMLLARYLRQR